VAGVTRQPLKTLEWQGRALRALPRSVRFYRRSVAPAIGGVASRLTGGDRRTAGCSTPRRSGRRGRRPTGPCPAPLLGGWHRAAPGGEAGQGRARGHRERRRHGRLRGWSAALLQAHDELPAVPLLATVPVSVRTAEQRRTSGNGVSARLAAPPTHLADPVDRLHAVHETMRAAKQHAALAAEVLQDMAQYAAPALVTRAERVAAQMRLADVLNPPCNLVVSDVPGPREPLYLAGARVRAYLPVSVVTDGLD
jgi:hypothetical protein